MFNNKGLAFVFPLLIVWFLLYLVIFHADLFSWINVEKLKLFVPNVFIPRKREDGLYNEAILVGAVSFISNFMLIIYYFILLKKTTTPEKAYNILKDQGKENPTKMFFFFILFFSIAVWYQLDGIHTRHQSSLRSKQWILSDPQRHLLMDFWVLNILYICVVFSFFMFISLFFFNAKKEK